MGVLSAGSAPYDVRRLEALGAFEEIELHRLAFIQAAVAVLLDGGEVNENISPGGPLDEAVTFGSIEPLHCTLLSHC